MRSFLLLGLCALTLRGEAAPSTAANGQTYPFTLLPLPYSYNALEPTIDQRTLEFHHDRHHKAYVDNLNKAVAGSSFEGKTLVELCATAGTLPVAVKNNAGGHWNHTFYWECMTSNEAKRKMPPALENELTATFGSVKAFKEKFRDAGLARFGSGYAWLIRTPDGALLITSTPNQDNPLMDCTDLPGTPLLVGDVWEHAYYLQYQNRRGDYLNSFWDVVNWDKVGQLAYPSK